MNKEKIVIVGPAYPYRGGQALVEAYLHQSLEQQEYDVHTVSYSLLYPALFFPGSTQFDESSFVPFEHSHKIKRLINSINPFTWYKAAKHIRQHNPAIVIFVWWMPFFGPALSTIARLVKRKTDAKVVFLVENYVSHEKRWFDRFLTKITLKHADAFICQSGYIHEQLTLNFASKPVYKTTLSIYDCYDLKRYDRSQARDLLSITTKKVILFFGLIRPYKGLDQLLRAFKRLLETDPDQLLLVVGECYENLDKYTDLINELGLASNVQMHNRFIPNEEIEPYFKAADLVCLPYNSGTQSGILMMAYGFKIPVVATNVGGISELIVPEKTGIIVPNNDPKELETGIKRVFELQHKLDFAEQITTFTGELGYAGMATFLQEIRK